MSAAVAEKEPRLTKSKKKMRDRVVLALRPHIRMRVDAMAKEAEMTPPLFTRLLVMEALEARGYPPHVLMADWHDAISASLREGKKHPYSLDAY